MITIIVIIILILFCISSSIIGIYYYNTLNDESDSLDEENIKPIKRKNISSNDDNDVEFDDPQMDNTVICGNETDNKIYRYIGSKLSLYPNDKIAASWDINWRKPKKIDCSDFKKVEDMKSKLSEGNSIKCGNEPDNQNIYRFTDGKIRWYPNPDIAAFWDKDWENFKIIDCSVFEKGADMPGQTFNMYKVSDANTCIYVEGDRNDNGTKIILSNCNNDNIGQKFTFNKSGQIKWHNTDKCLRVRDGKNENNTPIELQTCDIKNKGQIFKYENNQFKWVEGGRCFDVSPREKENTIVRLWDCNTNNANQKFTQAEKF